LRIIVDRRCARRYAGLPADISTRSNKKISHARSTSYAGLSEQPATDLLDRGLVFAALPRVRPGFAELRPRRSSFQHNAKTALRSRIAAGFVLRRAAMPGTSIG